MDKCGEFTSNTFNKFDTIAMLTAMLKHFSNPSGL